VGKSTLFNALAQAQIAHAANFPFATYVACLRAPVRPPRLRAR
jgi:ribosome-binding ATPase YchF (GTP1/OBG family)